jgi:hypothetical protein
MIDPRNIPTFELWADLNYPLLQRYGVVAQFVPGEDWKVWGSGLLALNGVAQRGAPSTYMFDDWREWAMRLMQALNQGE